MVKTPDNPKLLIVDGHHRTLSAETLGVPAYAYVVTVDVNEGPWLFLHGLQKGGGSKDSSFLPPNSSYVYEEHGEVHDDEHEAAE